MKKIILYLGITCLSAVLFNSCYYDTEEDLYKFSNSNAACDSINVTYAQTIAPIMQTNCVGCHGGASPSAGLSLQTHAQVVASVNNNLLATITGTGVMMPPSGLMDICKINQVKKWIDAGMPNN